MTRYFWRFVVLVLCAMVSAVALSPGQARADGQGAGAQGGQPGQNRATGQPHAATSAARRASATLVRVGFAGAPDGNTELPSTNRFRTVW